MNKSNELVIKAIELIEKEQDVFRLFTGSVNESEILNYEKELGIKIDPGYRHFLSMYGAGSFGFLEVPGILPKYNRIDSDPRDSFYLTEKFRNNSGLESDLYIVGSIGDGCEWVLKSLTSFSGNTQYSPVYSWDMGVDYTINSLDEEYSSFGAFLLENVINAIDFSRESD